MLRFQNRAWTRKRDWRMRTAFETAIFFIDVDEPPLLSFFFLLHLPCLFALKLLCHLRKSKEEGGENSLRENIQCLPGADAAASAISSAITYCRCHCRRRRRRRRSPVILIFKRASYFLRTISAHSGRRQFFACSRYVTILWLRKMASYERK